MPGLVQAPELEVHGVVADFERHLELLRTRRDQRARIADYALSLAMP